VTRKRVFTVGSVLLGGVGLAVAHHVWPLAIASNGAMLPGLRIDGRAVLTTAAAAIEEDARNVEHRPLRLDVDAEIVLQRPADDFGVHVDRESMLAAALGEGRDGSLSGRAKRAAMARSGQVDVPLLATVAASNVQELLEPLRERLDEEPVDARIDLEGHQITYDLPGRTIDVQRTVQRIETAVLHHVEELEIAFQARPASVTRDSLMASDISHVLGSYETRFSRLGDPARAHNIDVAASHFDGLVLAPGAEISFNQIVGPRDYAHGYYKAHQIVDGEAIDGYGGGACQVASTLHAAAFLAGLEIVARRPHSRPSAYIPLGLDAAVMYDAGLDLRIRNQWTVPVVIHEVVGKDRVRTELLGREKPSDVTYAYKVLSTMSYERRVVIDPAMTAPKRTQKGIRGIQIRRTRTLTFPDGTHRDETSLDVYAPTMEVWHLPNGVDPATLPGLGQEMPAL
jgi:vancomycin resistance protein YoaR